jgi:hypothetical protein
MLAKFRSTNIMGLAKVLGFFGSLAAGFSYISGLQSARTVEGKKTALPALALWAGDYDGMQSQHVIRFLVPYSKTIFFIDRGEQLGTAAEWAEEFDKWVNKSKKSEIERMRVVFYRRPATNYSPR